MNFLVLLCCHGCCLTVDRRYYLNERTKVYDALGHRRGQQGLLLRKKKALEIQQDGLLLRGALNRKSLSNDNDEYSFDIDEWCSWLVLMLLQNQ